MVGKRGEQMNYIVSEEALRKANLLVFIDGKAHIRGAGMNTDVPLSEQEQSVPSPIAETMRKLGIEGGMRREAVIEEGKRDLLLQATHDSSPNPIRLLHAWCKEGRITWVEMEELIYFAADEEGMRRLHERGH